MPKQIAPQLWQTNFAQHPLFSGYRGMAGIFSVLENWPAADRLTAEAQTRDLRNAADQPLAFDPQTGACGQRDYEAQILATGRVPTRVANWHDFFNALVWLNFPRLKAALNAVQCDALAQRGTERGARSDAATVFDESGAVLIGPDAKLAEQLQNHDWKGAFVEQRERWQTNHLLIVGHAVLEKALAPYPGMITKALYLPWPALDSPLENPPEGLDAALAEYWQNGTAQRPADLFAIPVLGVPGMDPANTNPTYYDNRTVFRAQRKPI
jgi:hypothetical protein